MMTTVCVMGFDVRRDNNEKMWRNLRLSSDGRLLELGHMLLPRNGVPATS